MNLRTRIALLVAGTMALSIIVVSVVALTTTVREIERDADRQLSARADRLRSGFGRGPTDNQEIRSLFGENQPIQFIDEEGSIALTFGAREPLPVSEEDLVAIKENKSSPIHTVTSTDGTYRVITVPLENGGGLMLAEDLAEQQAFLARIQGQFIVIGLIGAAVAGLVASAIATQSLRPMATLAAAAERVATTQQLDSSIPVRADDEVGRVSKSFNTMLSALAASRSQQKRLIDDASHELRTPLTALRTNVELIQRAHDMSSEDRQEILKDVNYELEELTTLVDELVELAKDNHTNDDPIMDIDLFELVNRMAERAERRYDRKVIIEGSASVVAGRPTLIERAVSNLIENANKWGAPSTPIEIHVADGAVRVRDYGPGISDVDKPRVFDRFYRSDAARTMPGSGLGLSIVEEIVAFHGGETIVEDAPEGGAVVGFKVAVAS